RQPSKKRSFLRRGGPLDAQDGHHSGSPREARTARISSPGTRRIPDFLVILQNLPSPSPNFVAGRDKASASDRCLKRGRAAWWSRERQRRLCPEARVFLQLVVVAVLGVAPEPLGSEDQACKDLPISLQAPSTASGKPHFLVATVADWREPL